MTNPQTTFTDAEYIRLMKREGFPASCKEQAEHNERLDRIARRLEYLEKNDANAN